MINYIKKKQIATFSPLVKMAFLCLLFITIRSYSQDRIDSLKKELQLTNVDSTKVKIYNSLGKIYWSKSDYKQAVLAFKKTLEHSRNSNNTEQIAKSLGNLGVVNQSIGEYDVALNYFFESLKLKQEIGDTIGLCNTYNNIGVTYDYLENHEKALQYFQKALDLSLLINYDKITATTYNGIGIIYKRKNQLGIALNYFFKSINLKKQLNYQYGLINSYDNVAEIYSDKKNYPLAIEYHEKSLEMSKEMGNTEGQAGTLILLGFLYNDLNEYNNSIKYLHQGTELALQIENNVLLKSAYEGLSYTYKNKSDFKNALKYHELFTQKKDSLFNLEKSEQLATIQTQFDIFQKEQEITLLNKNKEILEFKSIKDQAEIKSQKYWLFLIALLSFLGASTSFFLFKNYKAKKKIKENKLQQLNLDTENKLLRTQMNPHFIFNSLTAIQNYILRNKTDIASHYISDFSNLIRAILNNSKKTFIELSNEIDTLELYLKLEQVRFDNKFTYQINYSPELEIDFIQVPPMILQPFVENSILHGILNKKEKGLITIDIADQGDVMYCVIQDDGIGREAANQIKQNTQKKNSFASLGIEITTERINLLNKELGTAGKVIVSDLFNKKQQAIGTKVEIYLPINN